MSELPIYILCLTYQSPTTKGRPRAQLHQGGRCLPSPRESACRSRKYVRSRCMWDTLTHRRTGRFILVADYRKNVEYLGTNVRFLCLVPRPCTDIFPVHTGRPDRGRPICVRESAAKSASHSRLAKGFLAHGGKERRVFFSPPMPVFPTWPRAAGPVVSDNGNFIIDAPFDLEKMKTPYTVSGGSRIRHTFLTIRP